MADSKLVFPQIPSTVWWGLREQFKKTIPSKVTPTYLVSQLGVQATAAKAYLAELRRVALIDDDGKPTEVAKKWRLDDSYREAADQMLHQAYPEELIQVAPPTETDRAKAIRWFMEAASLGEGAAKNKASTYFLIGGNAPPTDGALKPAASKAAPRPSAASKGSKKEAIKPKDNTPPPVKPAEQQSGAQFPLNVNVQIHISADATGEQIEAIFLNMKKYLG